MGLQIPASSLGSLQRFFRSTPSVYPPLPALPPTATAVVPGFRQSGFPEPDVHAPSPVRLAVTLPLPSFAHAPTVGDSASPCVGLWRWHPASPARCGLPDASSPIGIGHTQTSPAGTRRSLRHRRRCGLARVHGSPHRSDGGFQHTTSAMPASPQHSPSPAFPAEEPRAMPVSSARGLPEAPVSA